MTTELYDWQTFPQLYVKGELVGGCDIIEEMHDSGELAELLGVEHSAAASAAPENAAPGNAAEAGLPAQSPPLQIEN